MATLYSNVHRYATCGTIIADFIDVRHRKGLITKAKRTKKRKVPLPLYVPLIHIPKKTTA